MLTKEVAVRIKESSLKAIAELDTMFFHVKNECEAEDSAIIRRGVGYSIIKIQTDLLSYVYDQYPELDDLRDLPPHK